MQEIHDLTPHLDPELAGSLQGLPEVDYWNVEDWPALRAEADVPPTPAPAGMAIRNLRIPGLETGDPEVAVRLYRPAAVTSENVLVWIHGGGFVRGNINSNDAMCISWAQDVGCNVVSVDYRLAPEHPFPAAPNDCFAALRWAASGPEEIGITPSRIAVGGASAGGCIAAGVALMARDRRGPELCYQLLVIPVLDDRLETPSSRTIHDPRTWNRRKAEAGWHYYLGGNTHGETSPYAAPARAAELAGLPPATVLVEEMDLLRDEGVGYANRLTAAGVRTDLIVYAGTFHGHATRAPEAAISKRLVRDRLEAVQKAFRA